MGPDVDCFRLEHFTGEILVLGISCYLELLWTDIGGGKPKAKPFLSACCL